VSPFHLEQPTPGLAGKSSTDEAAGIQHNPRFGTASVSGKAYQALEALPVILEHFASNRCQFPI